ncbi:MAG: type II toxin-antitoxin system VapC family toxin [Candidatus Lokiarchaeota archaeon]|nr:type II toxin-antitoxin system VapC family toxin [Candidatus Lokiarchaeota archaeon]
MVVLDTDFIIGYLREAPKINKILLNYEENKTELKTTIINLGELYKGAYLSANISENIEKIDEFLKKVEILDLNIEIIKIYAKISADLRKKGEIIGDYDELIASITIYHQETLLTRNVLHYKRIPKLSFQNWEKL